jgi:hypothetical protein
MRFSTSAAALLLVVAVTGSARADGAPPADAAHANGPPPADAARAETLFQEGKKLLEQSSFDAACTRLALSDALDPTISTLGLLAACHEQQGRTATAWQEYRATQKRAEAVGDSRADFARQRAAALEPGLPRLLIHFEKPSPGVQVLRNLEAVTVDKIGVDVPVDPGAYEIIAQAPNRDPYRVTVTAKEGARVDVAIPELLPAGSAPRAARPVEAPPAAPPRAALVATAPPATPPPANPRLPAVAVLGAAGVIGLGVGVVFGIAATNKNLESTTLHETCSSASACAAGAELRDSAFTSATISTVGFGVGVASLGAGALLLLLPSGKSTPPSPGSGGAPSTGATVARTVRLTPLAGAEGGGALLSGRF